MDGGTTETRNSLCWLLGTLRKASGIELDPKAEPSEKSESVCHRIVGLNI